MHLAEGSLDKTTHATGRKKRRNKNAAGVSAIPSKGTRVELRPRQKYISFCLVSGKQREPQESHKAKRGANSEG